MNKSILISGLLLMAAISFPAKIIDKLRPKE